MKLKFDMQNAARNFNAAVNQLAKLTGIDKEKIIRAEAGSILKRAMERTKPPPSVASMTVAGRLRAIKALGFTGGRPVTVTAGTKGTKYGKVWFRKSGSSNVRQSHDANFSPLNRHFTDEQWAMIRAAINDTKIAVKKVVAEKKGARGLARQSWVLIADSLGIKLEQVAGGSISAGAIASYRAARVRGNLQARNGTSKIERDLGKFAVTLINRLPYGQRLGFQGILDAAIAGRAKFMQTALAKGFAASAQDMQKLFPGWAVTTSTS